MVISAIVTPTGKVVGIIMTITITVANVCFGNALRPIHASEFFWRSMIVREFLQEEQAGCKGRG